MSTIFPREEKAELLFEKILSNPKACRQLQQVFYEELESGDEVVHANLSSQEFVASLLSAYANKDLTAFLMAICQNSMFDLLRQAHLAPFKFNADGEQNPILLTNEEGELLDQDQIKVHPKDYQRFKKVFKTHDHMHMYLANGYRKKHSYNPDTMQVESFKTDEYTGILLLYECPDTIQKETEAQAYAALWDLMMEFQEQLPHAIIYYGQDGLEEGGQRYDELGVFLHLKHFHDRLEQNIEKANQIVFPTK